MNIFVCIMHNMFIFILPLNCLILVFVVPVSCHIHTHTHYLPDSAHVIMSHHCQNFSSTCVCGNPCTFGLSVMPTYIPWV
jgi:hypothetical protein